MKILYDYQAFTRQFYGGISRYFVEIAKKLSNIDDTQLQIFAPFYINHYVKALDPEIVVGRQVKGFPKAIGRLLNLYNLSATRRQVGVYKPDILHETYFSKHSVALAANQARVLTVHDMIHELYPDNFSAWDRASRNKRLAVARADHIICVSENTRRDLLDIFDVPSSKVSVVHHGFDYQQAVDMPRKRLVDEPYLLYVGIRSGYKNFSRLLEAYAATKSLHRNYRLVCFGGGEFTRSEVQHFKELGLPSRQLLWMGGGDNILTQLYQHAIALVFPSLYEGFGIPLLEAMAHNCPVICSFGSSISEVVGDAGKFFDPRDRNSIAQAIEAVAGSAVHADKLRSLGQTRVRAFTWEKCASSTLDVYSSLT